VRNLADQPLLRASRAFQQCGVDLHVEVERQEVGENGFLVRLVFRLAGHR